VKLVAVDEPGGFGAARFTLLAPAEVERRTAAVLQSIHDTFHQAREEHNLSVVLLTQADMFDPTVPSPASADHSATAPIVQAIARESAAFRGPVYLINGDSHVYGADKPLAQGSSWLGFSGVPRPGSGEPVRARRDTRTPTFPCAP